VKAREHKEDEAEKPRNSLMFGGLGPKAGGGGGGEH